LLKKDVFFRVLAQFRRSCISGKPLSARQFQQVLEKIMAQK
jgi:hypothetical protein